MFERILVPLDGSTRAEEAIPVAARIARAFGGSILLLQVVIPPVSTGKYSVPEMYPKRETDEELTEANEYLKTVALLEELSHIPIEKQALVGEVAPAILDAAHSLHATLIVLNSHGYTGFKRWMLGSVAEKIIRHASIPVVVVRGRMAEPATTGEHPVRILAPLDGSALSEAALEPAAKLAAGLSHATSQPGLLQLMRVVAIPSGYGRFRSGVDVFYEAQIREDAKREDEQYLHAVTQRLAETEWVKDKLQVTTVTATDSDAAEAIVKQAEAEPMNFIAMATHGRGGVQRWALGSTTERVLHATTVPLFIVKFQHDSPASESPVQEK
jgi:nucleotide-binding universal stress UspA family protein